MQAFQLQLNLHLQGQGDRETETNHMQEQLEVLLPASALNVLFDNNNAPCNYSPLYSRYWVLQQEKCHSYPPDWMGSLKPITNIWSAL